MSDERPDRRRRAALAGHTGDVDGARDLLDDPDPHVRALALGALDRLGALDDAGVAAALDDPDAAVRRRGVELAATRPDVDVTALLDDPDPTVVELTAWAVGERPAAADVVERLVHLAGTHDEPLCREAAIAALGAIGNPAGLDAVLAGTADKPAVRRRAVVALAAFEGPEVEAALRAALDDRDWQVRQAAEDLLAVGDGDADDQRTNRSRNRS